MASTPATVPAVLTPAMRAALKQAGSSLRIGTEHRNSLIKQALSEGASLREVADAVGLSHTAIKKIAAKP